MASRFHVSSDSISLSLLASRVIRVRCHFRNVVDAEDIGEGEVFTLLVFFFHKPDPVLGDTRPLHLPPPHSPQKSFAHSEPSARPPAPSRDHQGKYRNNRTR